MQRATHRVLLIALSFTLLALLTLPTVRTSAVDSGKPLKEQEVLELLQGGVPSARVSQLVDDRGIDFKFTFDIEQKVRDAGGADDVVEALRRASQRRGASDQPRTGGLTIKTTPGEAQVYLNDEPRGMTSVEGEIRLPNLKPGSYTLRVSLSGYRSYEKAITIAAGDAQAVNVTLTPKPPVNSPSDNPIPSQPPAAPVSSGLPIPGVKTPNVQFYEGPLAVGLDYSKRTYRYSFDRFSARSVYWELDLSYPPPRRGIDFQIDAIWYSPNGSKMSRQSLPVHVDGNWGGSWHTLGYGYAEPGHWIPGTYRVDFYYQDTQIASGTFQIN